MKIEALDTYQTAEALRQFVLDHGLPHTDMTLIGLRCPYCGKSDRMRRLEDPGQISVGLSPAEKGLYLTLFSRLAKDGEALGVCKFCQNPVRLVDGVRPEALEEPA